METSKTLIPEKSKKMRDGLVRKHLPPVLASAIIALSVVFISEIRAGEKTTNVISFNSPAFPSDPGHHYSFEQSVESMGEEIIHPRDPYPVIPGKNPSDWFVIIEPTGWLPSVSGSASVKGLPSVDINKKANLSTLKQVLSHLNSAVGGKLEVRKGRWGLFGDGFFAQLSDAGSPPGPLYSNAAVVNKAGAASLSLAYRVLDDRRWFLDVFAGARYNYLGLAINTSTDPVAIQNLSQEAVSRLSQQINTQVTSVIAGNASAIRQSVTSAVQQTLSADQQALAAAIQQGVSTAQQSITSAVQQGINQSAAVQTVQNPSLQAPNIPSHLLDTEVIRRGLERTDGSDRFGRYVEGKVVRDALGQVSGQIQELAAASVQLGIAQAAQQSVTSAQNQLAQAQNQLASTLQNAAAQAQSQAQSAVSQAQNRVAQAQNNLASALSQKIQKGLPTAASGSQQWVDPIVGMRGQVNLTRVLFLTCAADVGGFGVGSQITWNTTASVGVNFTRQVFGEIGYRYLYTDYSNSSGFLFKGSEYGGFLGIGIKL